MKDINVTKSDILGDTNRELIKANPVNVVEYADDEVLERRRGDRDIKEKNKDAGNENGSRESFNGHYVNASENEFMRGTIGMDSMFAPHYIGHGENAINSGQSTLANSMLIPNEGDNMEMDHEEIDKLDAERRKRKREISRASHAKMKQIVDEKLARVIRLLKLAKQAGKFDGIVGVGLPEEYKKNRASANRTTI